jgi:DNA polymerase I-like protein with 3'-5' exonuclease and polymerase domains
VFRLIYGGSAYSYANDPNFAEVSKSEKFWQGVIDEFYSKYKGLHKWHIKLMQEATTTKMVKLPTGRIYQFEPELRRGEKVFPRTTILNYPVQGLGADLMTLARVSLYNRMRKLNYEKARLVNTVHDSIIIDCDSGFTDTLAKTMLDVFEDVPKNFQKMFGTEFDLPMKAEVQVGNNWKDMEIWVDK